MTYSEVLEFSVYVLLDPRKVVAFEYEIAGTGEFIKFEYQPFYVGKGEGNRSGDHVLEAKVGGRNRKCTTIRKLPRMGLQPIIVRVLDDVREIDALACELLRIKNLGRYSEHQLRDILSRKVLPKGTWRLACQ